MWTWTFFHGWPCKLAFLLVRDRSEWDSVGDSALLFSRFCRSRRKNNFPILFLTEAQDILFQQDLLLEQGLLLHRRHPPQNRVWKDGLTDWQTDSLANICQHTSKNMKSKFWKTCLQLLLIQFLNSGACALRPNISVYVKNTYNRPRVCFCDLHKI